MEIIKPGNLNKLKQIMCFECRKCGCIFTADNTEYEIDDQYNQEYYACKCPTCGNQVVLDKSVENFERRNMGREDPMIEKVNGITFDVELDNGKNAIIKFKFKDGSLLPDMSELSFVSNPDKNIARMSFNYSAFDMKIEYH